VSEAHPHAGGAVAAAGPGPDEAAGALILFHGRGASAESILTLAPELGRDDLWLLAPQASGGSWWPQRFTAPFSANEPWLGSALARAEEVIGQVVAAGVPSERIALAGFSQGACLAAEAAARHGAPLGALVVLAGGLVGPPGTAFSYSGRLDGMPVVLSVGDRDHHIPVERAETTARTLAAMGAAVDFRVYEGLGHQVVPQQIDAARTALGRIPGRGEGNG
jgi:predicted esterase